MIDYEALVEDLKKIEKYCMLNDDQILRQDMMYLLGLIDAIQYPIMWQEKSSTINQGYYDLLDSIRDRYVKILKETIGYKE